MMYFVISNHEGDTYVQQMNEKALLKRLNPDENNYTELDFSKALMGLAEINTNHWGGRILIIKGEIVVPREEQIVTRVTI